MFRSLLSEEDFNKLFEEYLQYSFTNNISEAKADRQLKAFIAVTKNIAEYFFNVGMEYQELGKITPIKDLQKEIDHAQRK